MEKELIFSLISTLLIIIGITPLWRDIIRWRTIPHPFTVGVWLILVSINIYILYVNKQYIGLLMPIILWVCLAGETLIGSMRIQKLSINWFDFLCLALSMWCLIYIILFQNLLNTAILTVIIDFLAILPTFKKSWIQPWTETAWNFFISWIAQLFTLLALTAPNTETLVFWWYVFVMDVLLVIFILSRRYSLKWWHSIFE